MGIYSVKPKFQKFLMPVERLFVKLKIHPTIINILALILSVAGGFALYYSYSYPALLVYIPFMAFFRTALNALDGMVARALKVKNQGYGEVLNEFLDRVSDASIFFGFALAPYTNIILGSAATIIILLNSYLSIVSKAGGGKRQYGGIMGKADRMIYIGAVSLIIFIWKKYEFGDYFFWFIGIGTLITMLQRFISIRKELKK